MDVTAQSDTNIDREPELGGSQEKKAVFWCRYSLILSELCVGEVYSGGDLQYIGPNLT